MKTIVKLGLVAVLVVFAPALSRAATKCEATCPGGSCSCSYCQCGCSGGAPWCENSAILGHTSQGNSVIVRPFAGGAGDINLSAVTVARDADHGDVTALSDGAFLYSPDPDFIGLDSFTFSACDFSGQCDLGTVLIDVVPRSTAS